MVVEVRVINNNVYLLDLVDINYSWSVSEKLPSALKDNASFLSWISKLGGAFCPAKNIFGL